MVVRKKQRWDVGVFFLIPLRDGSSIVGQVLQRSLGPLGGCAISLYDVRGHWNIENFPRLLKFDSIFSVLLTTPDFLGSAKWPVVASEDPLFLDKVKSFLGGKVRGCELVESFANAFYGLEPWDDWYIPNYLDDFLISAEKKPFDRLVFCGRHGSS